MTAPTVLIVEDEAIIAMGLEDRLVQLGYTVAGAVASGDAALQLAASTHLDLVLVDIHLQGSRDGIATASELQARYDIPIVYLTAYADDLTMQRAHSTEPFGYLLKPFRERELHATIEMALYRHRSERELRRSRAQYERVVKHIKEALIVEDAQGHIAYANDDLLNLLDCTQAELSELNLADYIAPEWREQWHTRRQVRAQTAEGASEFVCLMILRDGQRKWVELTLTSVYEDGHFIGWQTVLRDITARQQAEAALREQQQLIERVTQTMPDVVCVWNLEDQREVFVNREIGVLLGYPPDTIRATGLQHWQLIHAEDLPHVQANIQQIANGQNGDVVEVRYRMQHANGTWNWLTNRITVFSRAEDGRVLQLLCIVQDITERVHFERLAIENERLAASGRLAASVAHDLNTPLQTIQNLLHLAANDDPAERDHYLRLTSEEIERVGDLTRHLIDLHWPSDSELKPIDINPL